MPQMFAAASAKIVLRFVPSVATAVTITSATSQSLVGEESLLARAAG